MEHAYANSSLSWISPIGRRVDQICCGNPGKMGRFAGLGNGCIQMQLSGSMDWLVQRATMEPVVIYRQQPALSHTSWRTHSQPCFQGTFLERKTVVGGLGRGSRTSVDSGRNVCRSCPVCRDVLYRSGMVATRTNPRLRTERRTILLSWNNENRFGVSAPSARPHVVVRSFFGAGIARRRSACGEFEWREPGSE